MQVLVTVSGVQQEVEDGLTVGELLRNTGVDYRRVVVELNRRILRREQLDVSPLHDGDVVEVVRFVGGG